MQQSRYKCKIKKSASRCVLILAHEFSSKQIQSSHLAGFLHMLLIKYPDESYEYGH